MLKNYFITSLRAAFKHKFFAALNISGLAVGLAVGMLILQYATYELSYDQFHIKKDRIFRVDHTFLKNGEVDFQTAKTYPRVGPAMMDEFPEVEQYCRFLGKYRGGVVRYEDKSFREQNLFYADTGFFKVFSFPWLEGDKETALRDIHTVIIDDRIAKKYFGNESVIGKRITVGSMDGLEEFEVRGVFHCPDNSHIKLDFIFSYTSLISLWGEDAHNRWGWYDFQTYLLLKPGVHVPSLTSRFSAFVDKNGGDRLGSKRVQLSLRPLTDIHLNSHLMMEASVNGNSRAVYFLIILAVAVLVIAWINFINLATARGMERAKEVGIRRLSGSTRLQLAFQFILEAFLINGTALVLSLILIYTFLPLFNELTGKQFDNSLFFEFSFYSKLLVLFISGSLFSGFYPSLVLSSFQPIKVLKGSLKYSVKGLLFRKGLVVAQFCASVILIAGTIIIYNQMTHIQSIETGIDMENTLVVKAPDVITERDAYMRSLDAYKQEMLNDSRIKEASLTSEIPGRQVSWYGGGKRIGIDQDDPTVILFLTTMDENYFSAYQIDMVAGRPFSKDSREDSTNIIVNEKAIQLLGFENAQEAVHEKLLLRGDTFTIIGVAENYYHESPKEDYKPSAYLLSSEERSFFTFRYQADSEIESLQRAESSFSRLFPGVPFEYFFLTDFYSTQYSQDKNFLKSFMVFALIAIVIALLGLFGLSSYMIVQRTKEVGVRKVLGSSSGDIFVLFLKEFFTLIVIGNLIAIPLVYLFMEQWLNEFSERITIGAGVFIITTVGTLLLALSTISFYAIKASKLNPAKALRYE
ncbi:MAG: ABC transporter permease [Cyclobacteriaceae bacterium]|nr:ABC transporter permease [Cyclobacteriaceae bacterium]